jgi:phytoene synthase
VESQDTTKVPTGLVLYSRASHAAAKEVIYSYSTSFGLATRLLDRRFREHVENIYAMVRVADEIVDGSAAEAQRAEKAVSPEKMLSEFENETYRAMELGYSTNLILHAFAQTARLVGIKKDIVEPFFASMRMDLTEKEHDPESFAAYVYGSAEVVGLMCLAVFLQERSYTAQEKKDPCFRSQSTGCRLPKGQFSERPGGGLRPPWEELLSKCQRRELR